MSASSGTTSGARANKTGNQLEQFVYNTLIGAGYKLCQDDKKTLFKNRSSVTGKQFQIQVHVGKTIYESDRKVDFLVLNKNRFSEGLIIECKWQQSPGSVDEKYPFLLHNIIKTNVPTVVLLDGGGYKPMAKKWLSDQVSKETSRALIGVWEMRDFQKKVNDGFLD